MGKPLAIIPDARINGPAHTVVERLLSISGEDVLTIDRKNREPWSGKLPTRIMVLSNEIPRFTDSSGAIANRLLVLQMRQSFLGREDRTLDARLTDELPGILNWALEGLDRLTQQGRFTVPSASSEATTMLMDLASPVSAFVRECCYRGQGQSVTRDRLYLAWRSWCADNGHEPGSKATFGRNLAAVVPDLGNIKPRVDGVQIRCYAGIGLLRASPDSIPVSAGQNVASEARRPDSPLKPRQAALGRESGAHASGSGVKPQVAGFESGEAGESAFSDQLHPYPETAADWLMRFMRANAGPGGWVKPGDVIAAGRANGISHAAIMKAKRLYVDTPIESSGNGRGSMWRIVESGTETAS